ncbi:16788_t:CDS:1, partial [Gigaspora rosea]
ITKTWENQKSPEPPGQSKKSTTRRIERVHHRDNRKESNTERIKSLRITGGSLWTLLILRENQKSPQRTTSCSNRTPLHIPK